MRKSVVGLLFLIIATSCDRSIEIQKGFYYWKNSDLSEFEEHYFKESGGEKLYLKIFEIELDELEGPIPTNKAWTQFDKRFLDATEIVPVIFIDNEVIEKSTDEQLVELADNMMFLTDKFISLKLRPTIDYRMQCREIQIDCDWMESTKEKYFQFLSYVKERTSRQVSCTLRLYPYKFQEQMGVPPVDRVMLLCYNLLSPLDHPHKNTILDLDELIKYVEGVDSYDLPMDVALPIYSSVYKYSLSRFDEVEHGVDQELENIGIPDNDGLTFTVKSDTTLGYRHYHKGTRMKIERVTPKVLIQAAEVLKDNLPLRNGATIAIYHLDNSEIRNFEHETINSVYSTFN